MGAFSKTFFTVFEICNELYTAIGAGVFGMIILVKHGLQNNTTVRMLSVVALTTGSLIFITRQSEKTKPSKRKVIFVTGCDSGLGFSLAQHAADTGFTVVAGFLNLESKGAQEIQKLYSSKEILPIRLDITDSNSIQNSVTHIKKFLNGNPTYVLHAIVNNAGVMVFGEFEWLTEHIIEEQLEVNLLGTFKFTRAFCPLLRQYKGRIITVTSHCALANLPGVTVYGATKAALASWSDGLRIELGKYGVQVIQLIPGSFTTQSNIMSRQLQYVKEMHDSFTPEQHSFYSDYFKRYNIYLSYIKSPPGVKKIDNPKTYQVFEEALLHKYPKHCYKSENARYGLYHFLFRITPIAIRDYLVTKFMQMPQYEPQTVDDDYNY